MEDGVYEKLMTYLIDRVITDMPKKGAKEAAQRVLQYKGWQEALEHILSWAGDTVITLNRVYEARNLNPDEVSLDKAAREYEGRVRSVIRIGERLCRYDDLYSDTALSALHKSRKGKGKSSGNENDFLEAFEFLRKNAANRDVGARVLHFENLD